jgi:hypothetical protein
MEGHLADQNIRRYLLGELVEAEQQRLEESLLTSDEMFEELLIVEDELVDEYVNGQLAGTERESFEQHFLSTPERVEKLRFARAFKRQISAATASSESPEPATPFEPHASSRKQWLPAFLQSARHPVLNLSLAAALLLMVVGGSLWFMIRSQGTPEIAANRAPDASHLFAVTLTPGAVRDAGEMKRVVIPDDADVVQLRLEMVADEYPTYHAVLQTDDGREIFTGDRLKTEMAGNIKVVALSFPAKLLARSDYQVKLSGTNASGNQEVVGRYYFRLVKS